MTVHSQDPFVLPLLQHIRLETPLDWTTLWEELAQEAPAVLLESSGSIHDASQWVLLAGGVEQEIISVGGNTSRSFPNGTVERCDIWAFLDSIAQSGTHFQPFPYCLSTAWFGLFSYEFGKDIILRQSVKPPSDPKRVVPEAYFFKPKHIIAFNRKTKELFVWGDGAIDPETMARRRSSSFEVGTVRARMTTDAYQETVRKIQAYINSGDIYQANPAQSFEASWKGNEAGLYRVLREINPGPFMGIFKGKGFTVVSSSPERLGAGQGTWLESRPIAGTRPRGSDELQDLQLKLDLTTNAKEQAEHLMLVDLARNDLGRVADYGTVRVTRYADVESYAKVHHLVSTVEAKRRDTARMSDIFRSLFPGGTITGCPKVRCMEIIDELESLPRGFYTGSMGYIGPGPSFDLNILIRTFTLLDSGTLEFFAGAGIVADSDPKKEYLETLYKVEALAQALGTTLLVRS
jgi:anthranilate/para-aminobenzoate synthase component I